MFTRRAFLKGATAGGIFLAMPASLTEMARAVVPTAAVPFTRSLPIPPFLDVTGGGTHSLELTSSTHDFYAGSNTAVFRYRIADSEYTGAQATVLGPTLVARRGTPVSLSVTNLLGAHPVAAAIDTGIPGATGDDQTQPRAVVHLHGGHTALESDGGPEPERAIANGATKQYTYGNLQQSANLWYHDHVLGITRLNVYAGLAGGYLIRDSDDDGSGNRFPAPPYEIPLIIQDRMFDPVRPGQLLYPPNATPAEGATARIWIPEFFGDVATVNGEAWPYLEVERGKYRFRVYNGSQARFYKLSLVDPQGTKVAYQQIGTDGGLLNTPVTLTGLTLGPGERADLVVDFAAYQVGTTVRLTNNAPTPFPNGPRQARKGGTPLPSIMEFRVTAEATSSTFTKAIPNQLRATPITRLAGNPVAATRNMALVEVLDANGLPRMALLNDRPFYEDGATPNTAYQAIEHKANTLEQWNLINLTVDAHPIHLHLVQFQLLNRQPLNAARYLADHYPGLPLTPMGNTYPAPDPTPYLKAGARRAAGNEAGWKDTVVAMPGEVTRLLVPLGAGAVPGKPMAVDPPGDGKPYTGDYVWHCHILEHEENDMMQYYRVVP